MTPIDDADRPLDRDPETYGHHGGSLDGDEFTEAMHDGEAEADDRSGMTDGAASSGHEPVPVPDEPTVPEVEADETVAPRPEEEIADILRAEPDTHDHS